MKKKMKEMAVAATYTLTTVMAAITMQGLCFIPVVTLAMPVVMFAQWAISCLINDNYD